MIAAKRQQAGTAAEVADRAGLRAMINEAELLTIIRISRTTLFRMIKAGKFPRGVFVSENRKLWYSTEIAQWQSAIDTADAYNPNRGRGKGRRHRVSPSRRGACPAG